MSLINKQQIYDIFIISKDIAIGKSLRDFLYMLLIHLLKQKQKIQLMLDQSLLKTVPLHIPKQNQQTVK